MTYNQVLTIIRERKIKTIAEFSNELLETGVNSNQQSENAVKIITFENEE